MENKYAFKTMDGKLIRNIHWELWMAAYKYQTELKASTRLRYSWYPIPLVDKIKRLL